MSRSGLAPPELDGFRYVDRIGGGGFADVYRYDQTLPERQVAVKVLHRGIGGPAVDSFRSEANLMAKLSNHPSIVTIYQAGVSADHRPFLVMEMCSSAHLGSRIAKRLVTAMGAAGAVRQQPPSHGSVERRLFAGRDAIRHARRP